MAGNRPCSKCQKPIEFRRSNTSGASIPISLDSKEKRWIFLRDGSTVEVDVYLSHFKDCAHASSFGKGAKKKDLFDEQPAPPPAGGDPA